MQVTHLVSWYLIEVLFLDVDGVLNCCVCDKGWFLQNGFDENAIYDYASPLAVQRVIDVCKQTRAHIVFNASEGKSMVTSQNPDMYPLPSGQRIYDVFKNAGVQIDGYAFDKDTEDSKLVSIAKYFAKNPQIENYIVIEDGSLFSNPSDDLLQIQQKYPDIEHIYLFLSSERQIDTNSHYLDSQKIFGEPYGFCENDKKKVIDMLIGHHKQQTLIDKNTLQKSINGDKVDISIS